MKVFFNALSVGEFPTGVQYYTRELIKAILKTASVKVHIITTDLFRRQNQNVFSKQQLTAVETFSNMSAWKRVLFENLSLNSVMKDWKIDVYHCPHYVLPWKKAKPSVITVHDTIALDYPAYCKIQSVLYHKLLLKRSILQAEKVIVLSETVKNDILRHCQVSEDRIEVIYPGISDFFRDTPSDGNLERARVKYQLPDRYILFVGNLEPKKNLERLVKAFLELKKKSTIPHKLVIAGKRGWKVQNLIHLLQQSEVHKEIILMGYVDENEMPALYRMADVFVFPSLYEGFGFPPLEAMACGTPVVMSGKGALSEISAAAAYEIDPDNTHSIAAGMFEMLTDASLRSQVKSDGAILSKKFCWHKAAVQTLSLYRSV